jgi:hypothetical protein
VSFDGSGDVVLTASVEPNSVALGVDTTGNYMVDLAEGTGITIIHTPGEASTASISIGQAVGTSSSVTFAHVTADVSGNLTGDVTGNADTATALETARTISLGGDLSGSVSFDGTQNVTITAAVQPNSIALGTDTTGNFVSDIVAGTGVTITHTPGEGSSASVSIGQPVATSDSVTFVNTTLTGALVGNAAGTTISTNSATAVYSFPKATYRTAEAIIQVTQGSKYTSMKLIVSHDGTTAYAAQYGVIEIGSPIIPLVITVDISGGDVRILATVTDANATNATVKVAPTLVTA